MWFFLVSKLVIYWDTLVGGHQKLVVPYLHVVAGQVRDTSLDTSTIIVVRQTDTLNVKLVPGSRTKIHLFICSKDGRCNLLGFVVGSRLGS